MALKEKIPLRVALRKNKNVKSTGYNKYYGEIVLRQGLTQRGLVDHIMSHIPGITKTMVNSVLETVTNCIPELVSQGVSVKLDGIGVFYPTVSSKGAANPKDLNVQDDIKGVRIRFRPDTTKLDNISSKVLLNESYVTLVGVKTGDGIVSVKDYVGE